jgi:hypothetical protein
MSAIVGMDWDQCNVASFKYPAQGSDPFAAEEGKRYSRHRKNAAKGLTTVCKV